MGVQEFLDLSRINILAATNNHVLRAARHLNVAVLPHYSQIARAKPSLGIDRMCRGFWLPVISLREHVTTRANFALSASIQHLPSESETTLISVHGMTLPTVHTRCSR